MYWFDSTQVGHKGQGKRRPQSLIARNNMIQGLCFTQSE